MPIEGLDILKGENGDDEHEHVYSQWMNYRSKPMPALEYRVCQVYLSGGLRCPHSEKREKAMG
jgi:hypothetical protein